uniref:Beta-amylase n=1 Tax=Oryza rufipogon TaxID=4529 RepID=A0A0E0N9A0_ORYRU
MSLKHPHSPVLDGDPPPHRRPRGLVSTPPPPAVAADTSPSPSPSPAAPPPRRRGGGGGGGEREREREKERTKLRERHRRAITSRMLSGLRQHGNFPLPARADMNDVLAALARAAGWTVHPDGTTFRASSQPLHPPTPQSPGIFHVNSVETPSFTSVLNSYAIGTPLDSQASMLQTDDSLSPSSLDSVVVADQSIKNEKYGNSDSVSSLNCLENHQPVELEVVLPPPLAALLVCGSTVVQLMGGSMAGSADGHPEEEQRERSGDGRVGACAGAAAGAEPVPAAVHSSSSHAVSAVIAAIGSLTRASAALAGDYTRTPYIPVYASLPMGIINSHCQLIDPEGIRAELMHLKSLNVDGVIVDCWWGIVEAWIPHKYEWSGYRDLFGIIKEFKLKVQAVLSFHGSGETGSGGVSLPKWVMEIAQENQDVFFTDREGRRNMECLSWGIDKERVLRGRTGIEAYFDFMRSFHMEFRNLTEEGLISAIEIGLGVSGELKYPSCPERMGWRYPGIGEFQCYDRYMQKNLRQAALSRGHLFWARGPDNAGYYNSRPHETGFFCDGGDYDSYYGRFFLNWYSGILIDHVDQVLSLATLAFDGVETVVKIPSIYWWYRTASHAAELTAGFYNPTNRDGYSPVFRMLKKHSVILKFVCYGPEFTIQENNEAFADPEGLTWQVMNSAWDHGLSISVESALPCLDGEMYSQILDTAKPRHDPDRHHVSFFAYRQLPSFLLQRDVCFSELGNFVKCMHDGSLIKIVVRVRTIIAHQSGSSALDVLMQRLTVLCIRGVSTYPIKIIRSRYLTTVIAL